MCGQHSSIVYSVHAQANLQCIAGDTKDGGLLDQVQSSFASRIGCASVGSSIYQALNTLPPPIAASVMQGGVLLVVLCL